MVDDGRKQMGGAVSSPYAGLAGHRLPGGRVRLEPQMAWLWAACVTGEPSLEHGHPSNGWVLAMRGCGLDYDEIFALVDATADSGVVLGEAELEFHRRLHVGVEYQAQGEVLDVTRRQGRQAILDRLRFRVELREVDGGALAFAVVNTMIFPRSEG